MKVASRALLGCTGLKRLGLSYNEPGIEPAMNDLFRSHPGLESVELIEAFDRHLPNRAKDDIGRAIFLNKARKLGFLQCDTVSLPDSLHITMHIVNDCRRISIQADVASLGSCPVLTVQAD